MANELVVLMSHGPTDEHASVGFTVVNGAPVFLTADAMDIVRRSATDLVHSQMRFSGNSHAHRLAAGAAPILRTEPTAFRVGWNDLVCADPMSGKDLAR